jgi:hypothetical protein
MVDKILMQLKGQLNHPDLSPELVPALAHIFIANQDIVRVCKVLIRDEISQSKASDLFRESSLCSQLLQKTFQIVGEEYVRKLFRTLIKELCASNANLETDPSVITDAAEQEVNKAALISWTSRFLSVVFRSALDMPE